MGPAGCGKSTVARALAESLALPYIEADELQPPPNLEEMSAGLPFSDQDGWDWLIAARRSSVQALFAKSDNLSAAAFLSCSALKRKYRDVIRVAALESRNTDVHFLYLHVGEKILMRRVGVSRSIS